MGKFASKAAGEAGMLNQEKAVRNFLEHVDSLTQLPLITDSEMRILFGEEVMAAIEQLDRYNQAERLCSGCESRCCLACRCELYAPEFGCCPIYEYRPVLCRLHFCNDFRAAGNSIIVELGDIFFDSLLAADREGNPRVRLFESPPLTNAAPALVRAASPWVEMVREGTINPDHALSAIIREAQRYHSEVEASLSSTRSHQRSIR